MFIDGPEGGGQKMQPDLRMVELLIEALTLQLNQDSHLYKTADNDALNEMYDALKHGMYQYRRWRDVYKNQQEEV